ncbi:MAG: hypothetical protein CM15mP38_1530 [Synechococcus sp.]|nr:MAG: hypothetical protein CM15mP38_1530 [Synechococcus sp.]
MPTVLVRGSEWLMPSEGNPWLWLLVKPTSVADDDATERVLARLGIFYKFQVTDNISVLLPSPT